MKDNNQQSSNGFTDKSTQVAVYQSQPQNGSFTNIRHNGNGNSARNFSASEPNTSQFLQEIMALQDKLERMRRPDKEEIQATLAEVQKFVRQVESYTATVNQELHQPGNSNSAAAAEQQLRTQRYQLTAITQAMSRAEDLESLLPIVVDEVQQALQVERVLIYRFESETKGSVVAEAIKRGWTPALGEVLPPTCFGVDSQGEYGQQPTVILGGNDTEVTPYQSQLLNKFQVQTSLSQCIPLQGKAWGLLVAHQCNDFSPWSEAEIGLLAQIATELALQLSGWEFDSQIEDGLTRQKTVTKVIEKIRQSLEIAKIFKTATTEVRQLLSADRVVVYRFNPDWSGYFVSESVGNGWVSLLTDQEESLLLRQNITDCSLKLVGQNQMFERDTYLQDTQGGQYSRSDRVRVINNVYEAGFPQCYLEALNKFQAQAYINVAIFQGEQLWGLFVAYQNSSSRNWQTAEISLMTQISEQLGVALQQVAVVEQQKEQSQKLQQAVERERTLALIVEKIQQSEDIQTIFNVTTSEVRQLFGADRVGIYRFNPDWSGEFVAESVAAGWLSLLREQENNPKMQENGMDCSLRDIATQDSRRERLLKLASKDTYLEETQGGTYRRGEKYRCTDDIYEAGFPRCYLEQLELFQARAYITVPIFQGQTLWGLLATYQNSGPRRWLEGEINLAVQLGSQLGIALQQAEYIEELKAQSQQMAESVARERAISQVVDRIKQSQDVETIFDLTTKEVRRILNADRVGIYRFNPDWSGEFVAESAANGWISLLQKQQDKPLVSDEVVDCSLQELSAQAERQQRLMKLAKGDTYLQESQGGAYRRGAKYYCVNDIYEAGFPPCYLEQLEIFQARAYVTVPIFQGQKLWGLLATYQNSEPRNWQEEEINLAVQLGSQLGIALQQVEYVKELEAKSEQMAKAVERERAIAKVIDRIKQSQDIDTIFEITTTEMRRVFSADRVGIYRFNPDWSGEFIAESAANGWISLLQKQQNGNPLVSDEVVDCSLKELSENAERQQKLNSLAATDTYLQETQGGAYRRGAKYYCVNDVYEAGFPPCYLEQLEIFQARAYVTVPIFQGEKLWGLLATYQNSEPRDWLEEEINLAVQIGSQLGIALQQAEYLQELRTKSETLAKIAEQEKAATENFQKRAIEFLTTVRPALDGNLTVRAPIATDVLGTIADLYNNTLQSLRQIVIQVKIAAAQVATTSSSSEAEIEQLSQQAQQQFQDLAQALEEVEIMNHSTQAVTKNAQAIGDAVLKANQTVQTGEGAMNRTVDGILDIRDSVAEAGAKIRELGEASQKISRVVNTISDFATQTQLLSLNAAIEATRAGEYGKGFAVVADEVRSLARKSATATTDIENLVSEVRSQISEVIKVTESTISQVTTGTNLVEETKASLHAIANATGEIETLVAEISQTTVKQLEQSQSVTQTMKNVSEIAANTSQDANQLATSFQESLATAQNLQSVVDKFKVD